MYCENCGMVPPNVNQKYCPNCGNPLRQKIELESTKYLFFFDPNNKKVWIWYGSNTTTRMKFIASTLAPTFRDRYGKGFQIVAVDERNEPSEFKQIIELYKVHDYTIKKTKSMNDNKNIRIFEYNGATEEFDELELEDNEAQLYELLGSEYILLFIDPKRKRVWVWYGIDTTIYTRVSAIKNAERIRDQHAFAFKVSGINEGFEPLSFRVFIGLEEEQHYTPEQIEPEYKGLEVEDELISHEQILLLLKKIDIPEGYERKIIIVNNEIYYYKEFEEIGSHVSSERLFTLKEEVEDGSYLMEDYITRLIFSFNKIKLIELLKKQDSK